MVHAKPRIFTQNFLLLCLANFTAFSSFYLLLATLPIYIVDPRIGGHESETGLIIGVFAASALILRPLVGRASDIRGKRLLIVFGAAILFLSSLLYNIATSVPLLLMLRILHGAGWAAFGTAAAALVADIVPIQRRGEAMGYHGMSTNLAMAIGPAAGVFLLRHFNFPVLFLSSAAVAFVAFPVSLILSEPRLPVKPANSPHRKISFLERSTLLPSLTLSLIALSYASIVSFLPLFARKQELGNVGLFFTVFAIMSISSRSFAGWLSDRYGRAVVIIPGLLLAGLSLVLLPFSPTTPGLWGTSLSLLGVAVIYGLAFATVQPALMALAIDRAEPSSRGAAMGTFTAAMDLGIGIGSFTWGFIAETSGYTMMYILAGTVSFLGMIAFAWGNRKTKKKQSPRF